MKKTSRLSFITILFLATLVPAVEQPQPLESGYFKWLLHLGQSPTDRILSRYPQDIEFYESLSGGEYLPSPGQVMDFDEVLWHPATTDMMIWTPQYSSTGFFAEDKIEGNLTQLYHIYIFSPEQRQARLWFRENNNNKLYFWNNGQMIFNVKGWSDESEHYEDFLLHEGINSMTFMLAVIESSFDSGNILAARITDHNNTEYADLTYSLSPPLPSTGTYAYRVLQSSYDAGGLIGVSVSVKVDPNDELNSLMILEYIPHDMIVVDSDGGSVIGNTIQWLLTAENVHDTNLVYYLSVPPDKTDTVGFCGYIYNGENLKEILGDSVLQDVMPENPWDMANTIETIDIDAGNYVIAENVTIGGESAQDYSGSLENFGRGLVTGLKPYQTGGWAEYEFSVTHPGEYKIVFDYGELWTMFHHSAEIIISLDGNYAFQTNLFPTTHSYGFPYTHSVVTHPDVDPERKAKWIAGSVELGAGSHTLRLTFPQMYPEDMSLDHFNDGRPVITKIIITNYPGLTLPYLSEPHHLDSYEHPPARIVHDRDITILPDGCVEMAYYGTFYSMSQGNEIYFANGYVQPRAGQNEAKFEIISIEPEVFHLQPEGEQDFILTVCSREPVTEDYSELITLWLQSTPSSPARKPYLFTTAVNYVELPPYKKQEFPWSDSPLLGEVAYWSRGIKLDVTDPAEMIIPDRNDLGFDRGRYNHDLDKFFQEQYREGYIPSVEAIFHERGWDYNNHFDRYGSVSWGRIWSEIIGSLYYRDMPIQAKAYISRLSENMVFYPVTFRWDWARPEYMPLFAWADFVIRGMPALAAHVRTCQENMIDNDEQFRILHNLVLPIFNSYWDELRTTLVLTEDANEGDTILHVDRPAYGQTGSPTDGFKTSIPAYVKIDDEPYSIHYSTSGETLVLTSPLTRSYPKGTIVSSWAFNEEVELECKEVISLIAVAAASRDPAVIDESIGILGEIYTKQNIFLDDGSFKNEPGSYGGSTKRYSEALLKVQRLFGKEALSVIPPETMLKIHNSIIFALEFPFSNGMVPMLNGGGGLNQLNRGFHGDVGILEELFPEDIDNITLYNLIVMQEQNRIPGDIIDNHNFVIDGWGYAMLRSENGSWDRGMETLLSSKYLLSDPGDHVSPDGLGIVIYGLGAILTPRYGYSWVSSVPPCLNQVMVDDVLEGENHYYGSFWHFDGREELPSAVAHAGDGLDSSISPFIRSRWCIQFPEYLFDAYFIEPNDMNLHRYDWSLINMGDLDIIEPNNLDWQDYTAFLDGYWPDPGTRGEEGRTIASKESGRIVADWRISNAPWIPYGDETLLRFTPEHSGCLRLIMADDSPCDLINAQIGYYDQPDYFQANSQDILVVRKNAVSHAFIDTLEPIADDEEAYVKHVTVIDRGNHQQQLVKVITSEGEDWVYLSGFWGWRPDGVQPVDGIITDADIVVWRVVNNVVNRVYIAGGSYANTPNGSWNFGSVGNHYIEY